MKKTILTVFILTYNHVDTIEKCIKSVLEQQTDFDFKIIIGDDCSTDGTSDIVRKYANLHDNIIPMIMTENTYASRKLIVDVGKMIDTEFYTVVEGDDYYIDNKKLQKQVDALRANPDCVTCAAETKVVDSKNNSTYLLVKSQRKYLKNKFYKWDIKKCPYCHTSSRMYRNLLPKDDETLKFISGDIKANYYYLDKGPTIFINEPMSVWNQTGSGVWTGMMPEEKSKGGIRCYFEMDMFFNFKYTDIFFKKYSPYKEQKFLSVKIPFFKKQRFVFEIKKQKQRF